MQRILIAPVTITATKPLLPTHIKGFLWLDVLFRSTREINDVEYYWNSRTPNLTGQTIQFWDYLDREMGDLDYAALSAEEIGRLYVGFHASGKARPLKELRSVAERVERDGWTHPAGRRMAEDWARQLELLGVRDPGLLADHHPGPSVDEVVETLRRRHLCVDHRPYGGPVYLDGTRWGMPLRKVIGTDGHANYVLVALRDLVARYRGHDHVVLVHDAEASHDFALIERVMRDLGAPVSRLTLGRVPLGGVTRSSRFGGWDDYTIGRLADLCLETVGVPAYRLGMRLYFIAMLKRTAGESMRLDLLRRALFRAERLVGAAAPLEDDLAELLRGFLTPEGWINPYRLTDGLFARGRGLATRELLGTVFL